MPQMFPQSLSVGYDILSISLVSLLLVGFVDAASNAVVTRRRLSVLGGWYFLLILLFFYVFVFINKKHAFLFGENGSISNLLFLLAYSYL